MTMQDKLGITMMPVSVDWIIDDNAELSQHNARRVHLTGSGWVNLHLSDCGGDTRIIIT